jgi:hypothetical protein
VSGQPVAPEPEPRVTDAAPTDAAPEGTPQALPADPEAYDSPRAAQARARGLAAPYIAGGEDPNLDVTRREERRYRVALVVMIVVVVLAGFVLGVIQNLLGG